MAWQVITMPFDVEKGEFEERKLRELMDRADVFMASVKTAGKK